MYQEVFLQLLDKYLADAQIQFNFRSPAMGYRPAVLSSSKGRRAQHERVRLAVCKCRVVRFSRTKGNILINLAKLQDDGDTPGMHPSIPNFHFPTRQTTAALFVR
jgi:hypothetical protein